MQNTVFRLKNVPGRLQGRQGRPVLNEICRAGAIACTTGVIMIAPLLIARGSGAVGGCLCSIRKKQIFETPKKCSRDGYSATRRVLVAIVMAME